MPDDAYEALTKLYRDAEDDGVFFVEYDGMPAAAGDLRDLEVLAKDSKTTVEDLLTNLTRSFMGAIVDLCVLGSVKGEDRVANCQSAWTKFKKLRERGEYPRTVKAREALGLPVTDPHELGTF